MLNRIHHLIFGTCLASLGAFGGFHVARLTMTLFRSAPRGPTPYPGLGTSLASFLIGAPLGAIVGLGVGIWLVRWRGRQGKPNWPTWIGMLVASVSGIVFLMILMSSPAMAESAKTIGGESSSQPMPRWVVEFLRFHRELGGFFLPAYVTAWAGLGGLLAVALGSFEWPGQGRLVSSESDDGPAGPRSLDPES